MNEENKLNDNEISTNNNSEIDKPINENNEISTKKEENINNNTLLNKNENNNSSITSKFKSSLRGSNPKIKKIKREIIDIFNDKIIIDKLNHFQNEYNSINQIDNFISFQEQYDNKLEENFNEKMKKIDEINEKYEPELNELYNYMEDDEKNIDKMDKDSEKVPSAIKIMYDSIMEDKNNEIKKINKEFEEKINAIKNEYIEKIESDKTMKNELYFSELFENIKDDIFKIIKPINNKKVSFLNEEKNQRNEAE